MIRSSLIPTLFLLVTIATDGAAQRAGAAGTVSVSAKIGGKSFDGSGAGSCRHAPDASIYDVPAALWMVELANSEKQAVKSLNLTLWRPKNGSPDQITLSLNTKSSSHRMSVGGKAAPAGSGTIKLSPLGSGGSFEIKGKDAKGATMEVTVNCPAFAGIEAEGG